MEDIPRAAAEEFMKSLHAFRTDVIKRAENKKKQGNMSGGIRKYPCEIPNTIDLAFAYSILPDPAQCEVDARENRWRRSYKPFGTISRSFAKYGEEQALLLCARQCWDWHFLATGVSVGGPLAPTCLRKFADAFLAHETRHEL